MQDIATLTGGRSFEAHDSTALLMCAGTIDALERQPIKSFQYRRDHEAFAWFGLAALSMIAVILSLELTVCRGCHEPAVPWLAYPWALGLLALLPLLGLLAGNPHCVGGGACSAGSVGCRRGGVATTSRPTGRLLRVIGMTIALLALILGIAGPQWGIEPHPTTAPGRDLVVLLDLSRSMAAVYVPPNRLGRAKACADRASQHRAAARRPSPRPRRVCRESPGGLSPDP